MPINKSKLIIEGENKSAVNAIKGVSRELNNAQRDIKGFGGGIGNALSSATSLLGNLPFMLAGIGTAAVAGFGSMIKETIDTAEHLEKMSQRVGVSVESLSTLRYAAQLSGTEISVLEKAIQRLSRNVYDAGRGIGEAKEAFLDMNINVNDTNGNLRDAEELMKEVADRFATMKDGTEKTALALNIFGRAGADLIPMLNRGSGALNSMQQEARDLGIEISTDTAKSAAQFKDNMLRLETSVSGLATSLTVDLLPALTNLSDFLVENTSTIKWYLENVAFIIPLSLIDLIAGDTEEGTEKLDKIEEGVKAVGNEYLNMMNSRGEFVPFSDVDLVNVEEYKKKLKELVQEEERLQKQWIVTEGTLEREISLAGLNTFDTKLESVNLHVAELIEKFGNKEIINEWGAALSQAAITSMADESVQDTGEEDVDLNEEIFNREMEQSQLREERAWEELEAKRAIAEEEIALNEMKLQSAQDTFADMSNAFLIFANLSQNTNKTLFGIYKAFSIAEAGVATYNAATKALATVPYPFNFAAAAAVTAAGLANVARIASMQPSSGAVGGGAPSAPPQLPRDTGGDRGSVTTNNSAQVTIYVQGLVAGNMEQIGRDLVPYIEKAVNDGVGSIQIGNG